MIQEVKDQIQIEEIQSAIETINQFKQDMDVSIDHLNYSKARNMLDSRSHALAMAVKTNCGSDETGHSTVAKAKRFAEFLLEGVIKCPK